MGWFKSRETKIKEVKDRLVQLLLQEKKSQSRRQVKADKKSGAIYYRGHRVDFIRKEW